jgi:A nuclease family of the HNH/ENDO VII superfamily with conserved AHH
MMDATTGLTCAGIDGAQNGVYLPGPKAPADAPEAYHRNLHNPEYLNEVLKQFKDANTEQEWLEAWERIRTGLQNNTLPGVRPRPPGK